MGLPVGVIVIGCAARTVAVGPAGAAVAAFAVVPLLDCDAAEGVVDKLAVSDRNIAEMVGVLVVVARLSIRMPPVRLEPSKP